VFWQGLNFDFTGVVFNGGDFSGAQFCGGTVNFHGGWVGGWVGGCVRAVRFSSGTVIFHGARFSGGTADFCDSGDWSSPPAFPWKDTPPPGVKLPGKEDQSET
jgi:hypothetical protein